MAFRRSSSSGPAGSTWRLAHQALLAACGVPTEVATSDRRWSYVLLHADDYPGTGWDVSWISPQQAADLLEALLPELPASTAHWLLPSLKKRAGQAIN